MANVRDSDTSLWLHNKLGTSNDSWTGGSICTQLNAEVLRNIKDCFPDLQTQVKLKLLLSFFHIPRRNVEEWRLELEEIMEVASVDTELWVVMLAEVMRTLPATGSLNTAQLAQLEEARPIFGDMVCELRRLVAKGPEPAMLPLECHYLNKAALVSVVGQQPNPVKHFTLKRKPKSAALRAELLQKSSDAMSNMKKTVAPTIPLRSRGMPRKMTDTTPLKGLPSRWSVERGAVRGGSRPLGPPGPPGRKDGGIKLLDIADQPATHHQKKRKRMLELEEQQKKAAAEAELSPSTAPAVPAPAPPTPAPSTLPEYARGLNNYIMPSTPALQPARETGIPPLAGSSTPTTPLTPSSTPTTPLPHTPKTPLLLSTSQTVKTPGLESNPPPLTAHISSNNPPPLASTKPFLLQQSAGQQKPIIISQQQKLLITGQPGQKPFLVTAGPGGTLLAGQNILKTSSGLPVILTNSVLQHATQNQQGQTILSQGNKTVVLTSVKQMNNGLVQQINSTPQQTSTIIQQPPGLVLASTTPAPQPQAPNLLSRKGLTLTRDQMQEATNMFSNANRVTRPEKALILGFMAGSRDNPCPNLGNIVTIKLSEDHENVRQQDDTFTTMLCETHFQMNYNNGQWMRIKKYRPLEGAAPPLSIPQHVN